MSSEQLASTSELSFTPPIVISAPEVFESEAVVLTKLLGSGVTRLHLRKPNASLFEVAQILEGIPPIFHPRIVVHAGADSAKHLLSSYVLGGVHLKLDGLEEFGEVQADLGANDYISLSVSCHKILELHVADAYYQQDGQPNYVFFSPVFPSISKQDYLPTVSLEELAEQLLEVSVPVIALGGIGKENLKNVENFGFSGCAVLGAIWKEEDPVFAWEALTKEMH